MLADLMPGRAARARPMDRGRSRATGRSVARRAVGPAVALAALLATPVAAAQAPSARLVYTRGAGAERCPEEGAIHDAVAARLGYDPFRADADMTVAASMGRLGRTLHARIEARDRAGHPAGVRTLSSSQSDCAELAAAVTLALSIAIDPLRLYRAPSPPVPVPAPVPVPTPPRTEPPPASAGPSPVERPRPPRADLPRPRPATVHLVVGGGGAVAFGAAPGPTVGFQAFVGLRARAASIALEARADLPATAPTPSGGEVDAGLVLATLAPCLHLGVAAVCALGSVGVLRGTARDPSGSDAASRRGSQLFVAVGARVAVEIPLHRLLALRLHADGLLPVTRTTVAVGEANVWTTPTFAGALGLGAVVTFR